MKTAMLSLILLGSTLSHAQERTVSFEAYCHSIYLSPASGTTPAGLPLTAYYTSYDGRSDRAPLREPTGSGTVRFSGEFRPDLIDADIYWADYILISDQWEEYGSIATRIPLTDSDANSVPDLLQRAHPVDAILPTASSRDWPTVSFGTSSGSVRVQRSAGQTVGTYSEGAATWAILNVTGTARFDLESRNLTVNADFSEPDGTLVPLEFTTKANRLDDSTVELSLFTARGTDRLFAVTSQTPTRLTRHGNSYRGLLQFVDGLPDTSWPDYTQWTFELTDPNDSDGDGIPDLSDATPLPTAQPTLTLRYVRPVSSTAPANVWLNVGSLTSSQQPITIWSSSDLQTWNKSSVFVLESDDGVSRSFVAPLTNPRSTYFRVSTP